MAKRKDFDIEIREELSRTVTVKAETLGDAINQVMDQYKRGEIVTCPRQHRHLKRKDSIRFLVSLVFSNFFIYTGCRKELAPNCRICVKIYSKAARPLSNLSGVSGNTLPASDNRLLHGSVFGYKISICTQIPRSWLPPGCGNAVRLTIPVLTSPRSSPSAHCPSSPLSGSCC